MNNTAQQFEQNGTLLFAENKIPLQPQHWQQLEVLLDEVEYEHVVGGDVGESHSVWVSRFVNDVDSPQDLSPHTEQLRHIVMSRAMRDFYREFTGTDKLCLRRCQANRLAPGDYVGLHKDQDSNPDYVATVVFHFSSDYRGGAFVTHDPHQGDKSYTPPAHTALVNNCSIRHEVMRVTTGERLTLACFLSKAFGPSVSSRRDFKLVK